MNSYYIGFLNNNIPNIMPYLLFLLILLVSIIFIISIQKKENFLSTKTKTSIFIDSSYKQIIRLYKTKLTVYLINKEIMLISIVNLFYYQFYKINLKTKLYYSKQKDTKMQNKAKILSSLLLILNFFLIICYSL